jgi:hypothetical protein
MPATNSISTSMDGWEVTNCPKCGRECFLTAIAQEIIKVNKDYPRACVDCAMNKGVS